MLNEIFFARGRCVAKICYGLVNDQITFFIREIHQIDTSSAREDYKRTQDRTGGIVVVDFSTVVEKDADFSIEEILLLLEN